MRSPVLNLFLLTFPLLLQAQAGLQYIKPKSDQLLDNPGGKQIAVLNAGTQTEVLEKRPGWVRIKVIGWIQESALTPDPTRVEGFTMAASHILLKTEKEANEVLRKLKSGASFDEMAAQYSIDKASATKGGSLGTFGRGDLVEGFEKAVLALKPGEISGVVKTPLGYHIIRRDN
jgi:hypothetical protein